ncbi:MAG: transcription elongation factor GreA [Candidatus Pacebacteria bacterium]|nr:transcription elongation factor GreA [Candidatus Paceibacterota bacterium]MBP9772844.1 transcription elongation factor GreA [Candidatus Paceibacterota bacterium]QQR76453.1 MAG: transcription elongation factor GreA [Candidatus Nomurabacteria bacterium]
MQKDDEYISIERKKALEIELHELQTVKRKEILENLEYAKSLGDLSENAEYHQARDEQGKLEERIAKIEHIIKASKVISKATGGTSIDIGSKVVVSKAGSDQKQEYEIVGSEEADMAQGRLSHRSPLGVALMGKTKGDVVDIESPRGKSSYKIVSVE